MPFASTSLAAKQPLLNSNPLGYGRNPLAPSKDAVTADGDIVLPLDAEAFGFWLKAAFGAPTTAGAEAPYSHELQSGSWTLPSMSIETGMPEVPLRLLATPVVWNSNSDRPLSGASPPRQAGHSHPPSPAPPRPATLLPRTRLAGGRPCRSGEDTMAKLIAMYRTPADPAAFDAYYFGTHVPIAKKIPGLRSYEVNRGGVGTPAGVSDFYLVAILSFDGMADIEAGMASPEGQAAAADLAYFAQAGAELMFFDTQEV